MLKKPIILSIIIDVVFLFALIVSSVVKSSLVQMILCLIIIFGFSLYLGKSQSKNSNQEISKIDKIKISLYYFIFWFVFVSSIVILMVMNTTLKDVSLFSFSKREIIILLTIFSMNFIVFSVYSLIIYYALGFGSKLGLKDRDAGN